MLKRFEPHKTPLSLRHHYGMFVINCYGLDYCKILYLNCCSDLSKLDIDNLIKPEIRTVRLRPVFKKINLTKPDFKTVSFFLK